MLFALGRYKDCARWEDFPCLGHPTSEETIFACAVEHCRITNTFPWFLTKLFVKLTTASILFTPRGSPAMQCESRIFWKENPTNKPVSSRAEVKGARRIRCAKLIPEKTLLTNVFSSYLLHEHSFNNILHQWPSKLLKTKMVLYAQEEAPPQLCRDVECCLYCVASCVFA